MDSKPAVQAPAVPVLAEEAGPVGNVIDQATANLIARVNAVSLTAEDLMLASAEIHKLPLATCNREARTRCLAPMFKEQGYKAFAINYRLEAMGRILRSGKLPNCWVLPGMVQEPVFLAAAKEPILFTKEEPFFEPESFLTFVLENAGVDGHA
jgi:hypothetical protein